MEPDVTITLAEDFTTPVYAVFSALADESIAITAKGLLEIAAWVEEHRQELEQEVD